MKHIKLFESFSKLQSINEDFMELKSIAKQLYSLLKKKGYEVEIKENSKKSIYRGGHSLVGTKGSRERTQFGVGSIRKRGIWVQTYDKGGAVEIHQFSDIEQIGLFLPVYAVAYQFIAAPENLDIIKEMVNKKRPGDFEKYPGTYQNLAKNWSYVSDVIFGQHGKSASSYDIQKNPELGKFIKKLGADLIEAIKSAYPNMLLATEDKDGYFGLYFAEPKTKKGAVVNPNQRPNKPNPNEKKQ